jgi:spore coat protein U-like protein
MKKLGFLLASIFVMMLATQQVKAQTGASASASAEAKATVVTVISITKNSDLNFGSFAPGANGGTVSVELDGTRSFTDGVTLLDQGEMPTRALFTVKGTENAGFYVKLPTDDGGPSIPLTGPTDADPMEITSFVHGAGESPALDGNGEKQFSVGGTLAVNPNQPAGIYTGTFDVIVAYN